MRLTSKAQLLEGGVVPERLSKRLCSLCSDAIPCEPPPPPPTHTHTEPHHQSKSE